MRAAPPADRFIAVPGQEIRTGFSTLRPVVDRETNQACLLKRADKGRVHDPVRPFAFMTVRAEEIATPELVWEDEESYYELLPMVNGWTLGEIVNLNEGVYGEHLTRWTEALLRIVLTLQQHDPPLIHRDIKPANLMVRRDDLSSLVLVDCTTMVPFPVPAGVQPQGTRGYAPAEAADGRLSLSTDIYAVGCTVFALNSGKAPPSPMQLEQFGQTMSLRDAEPTVQKVFEKLVSLDPASRVPNAEAGLVQMLVDEQETRYFRKLPTPLVLPDGRKLDQYGMF
jgi:serine/threonine protein kinase